jgi:hypothetical protein
LSFIYGDFYMGETAEFGELVSFLSKAAPDKLQSLQKTFPEQAINLKPGGILGGGDVPNVGCAVAIEALNSYAPAAEQIRLKIRQRLALSLRFDLLAKFAAACGSGGAVGVLAAGVAVDKAIFASAVALTGSICGLFFSYLQRDESNGSVSEAYNNLIDALVQCAELQRSLPILCRDGDSPELKDALNRANMAARTLNTLILRYS